MKADCAAFITHAGPSIGSYLGRVRVHMVVSVLRRADAKIETVAAGDSRSAVDNQ